MIKRKSVLSSLFDNTVQSDNRYVADKYLWQDSNKYSGTTEKKYKFGGVFLWLNKLNLLNSRFQHVTTLRFAWPHEWIPNEEKHEWTHSDMPDDMD